MKQQDITEYVKEQIKKHGRCVIYGLGVWEVVPARKGKHFDMNKREWVEPTKKYRIKYKTAPVFRYWLNDLEDVL